MKQLITRTAGLVLAFGIFFSSACSNITVQESSTEDSTSEISFERELQKINRLITENPDNDSLIVRKARLLLSRASETPEPSNRLPFYQSMRDLQLDFQYKDQDSPKQLETVIIRAWNQENRSGLRQLQENSDLSQAANYSRAIDHFENAITVLPDSISTVFLLSTTHYTMGNLTSAIETLELAGGENEQHQERLNEKLAYLYLESGDIDEAIRRYQDLVDNNPGNDHYRHGLANALIIKRDHDKAIQLLEELQDEYPNRVSYRESLAAEYYFRFEQNTGNLSENGSESTIDPELADELVFDLQKSDSLYQELKTVLPANEENLYTMAAFYSNAAYSLDELMGQYRFPETDEMEQLRTHFYNSARPFWEQLADLSPDNREFLTQLYQVYLALDMEERARTLEESLNLTTDL